MAPSPVPTRSRAAIYILVAIGPDQRHGYGIMREISAMTEGAFRIGPGTLYTTLQRLEAEGLVEESDRRPDPSLDDARRRYYRLTPAGRAIAVEEVVRMQAIVSRVRGWALEDPT